MRSDYRQGDSCIIVGQDWRLQWTMWWRKRRRSNRTSAGGPRGIGRSYIVGWTCWKCCLLYVSHVVFQDRYKITRSRDRSRDCGELGFPLEGRLRILKTLRQVCKVKRAFGSRRMYCKWGHGRRIGWNNVPVWIVYTCRRSAQMAVFPIAAVYARFGVSIALAKH